MIRAIHRTRIRSQAERGSACRHMSKAHGSSGKSAESKECFGIILILRITDPSFIRLIGLTSDSVAPGRLGRARAAVPLRSLSLVNLELHGAYSGLCC